MVRSLLDLCNHELQDALVSDSDANLAQLFAVSPLDQQERVSLHAKFSRLVAAKIEFEALFSGKTADPKRQKTDHTNAKDGEVLAKKPAPAFGFDVDPCSL
jgi:hypothetical protein